MKKLALILALMFIAPAVYSAEPTTKKVCKESKDAKTGKTKEICKEIKTHKKLEGTQVPKK
jgi:predicted RND superfamily exporter protein